VPSAAPTLIFGKPGRGRLERWMEVGAVEMMSVKVSSWIMRMAPLLPQVLGAGLKSPERP
jgi:hypothetical protein